MADNKTNPLWNMLKSVRLTLILLLLLAAASVIGTLIGGQSGAGIYHSLWFRLIIACLAVNLIVCSIDRFSVTLRLFRHIPVPDRSKIFEDAAPRALSLPGADVRTVSLAIQGHIRSGFNKVGVKESSEASFIYCEKGRFSIFSVYLVHLSVLFILAGALIGSLLGFTTYVKIHEGWAIDSIVVPEGDKYVPRKLGFIVRCDKFTIDYYKKSNPEGVSEGEADDSKVVKEYRSDLSFFVNGQDVKSESLRVNHPINFMGITFYQADYGADPGNKVRIRATDNEKDAEATVIEVEKGKTVALPGDKGELTLSDINENLMNMMGPAAQINIKSPDGQETSIWLFQDRDLIKSSFSEMFDLSQKFDPSAYPPFTFELVEIESVTYTLLQVSRDPGVQLVFVGFVMIIIGLIFTFFTSHRKFWISIKDENGDVKISLAGTASKNPVGLERALDRLLSRLEKVTGEGKHND